MKLNTETSDVQTLHRGDAQRSTKSQMRRSRTASQKLPKVGVLAFHRSGSVCLLPNSSTQGRGNQNYSAASPSGNCRQGNHKGRAALPG